MRNKQLGLTMVSWMLLAAFLGVMAVAALNIIPAYLQYFSVRSIMTDLKNDPDIRGKPPKEIKTMLRKRFRINNIEGIKIDENITLKTTGAGSRGFIMDLNYESRGPIIGNLDYVATFKYSVEINP